MNGCSSEYWVFGSVEKRRGWEGENGTVREMAEEKERKEGTIREWQKIRDNNDTGSDF